MIRKLLLALAVVVLLCATDQQVLEWTRGWLPEAAWEELRERLSEEAES